MTNLSTLATILNTKTSYTITQYPNAVASNGYNLIGPLPPFSRDLNVYFEEYLISILSTSIANLETAISAFLQVDSTHGTGHRYTNSGDPIWIDSILEAKNTSSLTAAIRFRVRWGI